MNNKQAKSYQDVEKELRLMEGYSDFQKINDYLFIGSQISALSKSRIVQEGITHVLRVNGVSQRTLADYLKVQVKVVDLVDSEFFKITDKDLEDCFSFIKPENRTIVVCTAGISRSATVCIAYLMKHEGLSLERAHAKVKEARRFTRPNPGFWRFLVKYEQKLK